MSQTNPNQEIEPTTTSPSTSNLVQESTTKTETSNPTETTPILSTPNRNGNGNDDDDDSDSESEDEGVIIRWRDPIKKPLNYSRIYRFMRPYALPATDRLWLISLANILVIVAIRAINLVPPYALKLAVDSIAINYRNPPFRELIIYLIAVMLRSLFSSANHVLQTILRRKAKKQFAVDSFTRMVHQDMGFHTKQKGGSRFRIMWRGAEAVAMLMQEILFNVIPT